MDLSDDPLERTEPIRKCGTGALQSDFRWFAVAIGYCVSGSNRQADYSSDGRANMCSNGVGAYIDTFNRYLMDVYTIQDPAAFRASVAEITAPTTMAPPPITDDLTGSAPVISTSLTLLFGFIFIALLFM